VFLSLAFHNQCTISHKKFLDVIIATTTVAAKKASKKTHSRYNGANSWDTGKLDVTYAPILKSG